MKKYLAIFTAPMDQLEEIRKNTNPEDMKQMMDDWQKWSDAHKASFVEQGAPVGKNMRVSKNGVKENRNEITGYSVVQAESYEQAVKIFQDNPQLDMPGAYIEVMEFLEMPGMPT